MALLIRADANTQMGTGHVMRCLALAQAWQEAEGDVHFALAAATPALEARLSAEGMRVVRLDALPGSDFDAAQTVALAQKLGATWLVVDGYHFDTAYQQAVKAAGLCLLFVDDYGHASHYYADLVLNQNIYAEASLYASRESYTCLLLGTRYALLRREFWPWRDWQREIPPVARKVLVTLGGSDPENVTLQVLRALERVEVSGLEALVVVGGSNPHRESLRSKAAELSFDVRLVENVSNMPELMAWADVAISAGGSTCWELAFMGLPNLILVLADNQCPVAESLDTAGIAVNLGRYEQLYSDEIAQTLTGLLMAREKRTEMSQRGRTLVNGKGCVRVVERLRERTIRLRLVNESDCRLLWEWANDPDVRAVSFSSEPIAWEQHVEWFESKLNDPHCLFFVAQNGQNVPIGQVRLELEGNAAVISISIGGGFRAKGYGSVIIRLASRELFYASDASVIHAYVKQNNLASKRVFVKAGYKDEGTIAVRGYLANHFTLRRGGWDEPSY